MREKVAYYAIIPANVRYDPDLPPNAKLLYGEITALCNEKGFCWASNRYFAELYGVSQKSISKWISILVGKNYLRVKLSYKNGSKEIDKRFLSINHTPMEEKFHTYGKNFLEGMEEKFHTPMEEKFHTPMEEKFQENNTSINNTSLKGDAKFQKNFANFSPRDILQLFNEICLSLDPVKYLTNGRREAIESALSKYSADQIEECFKLAESSPFLTGENKRNWKATFDWLIQEENIAKVLEGNFSDHDLNHAPSPISFDLDEFFESACLRAQESSEEAF